jgi:hypothetical protein
MNLIGFWAMDVTKPYDFIFFDFASIRELIGMAGRPRSRPLGVDPGPGGGGSEGIRGPPNPIEPYVLSAIQTPATSKC